VQIRVGSVNRSPQRCGTVPEPHTRPPGVVALLKLFEPKSINKLITKETTLAWSNLSADGRRGFC